jgi:hypothetical protein
MAVRQRRYSKEEIAQRGQVLYESGIRQQVEAGKGLMIYGVVNLRREATLPLVVGNSTGQREVIDTVIDTGFDGFLSLPSEVIVRLGLPWTISNPATLGDGSEQKQLISTVKQFKCVD